MRTSKSLTKADIREIEARVKRGAVVLDKREPGWFTRKRISMAKLDIASAFFCPLGQLRGEYVDGKNELCAIEGVPYGQEHAFCVRHGFYADGKFMGNPEAHKAFKEAWSAEIRKRRAKAK